MTGTTFVVLPTRTELEGRTWGGDAESRSEATSSESAMEVVGSPRIEALMRSVPPVKRGMIGDAVTALDVRTRAARSESSLVICNGRLKDAVFVGECSVVCQKFARSDFFFFLLWKARYKNLLYVHPEEALYGGLARFDR